MQNVVEDNLLVASTLLGVAEREAVVRGVPVSEDSLLPSQLREKTMTSVREIAAEVGIPSVSRFWRSFAARYGTIPKEYRQTHLRIDWKRIVEAKA